MEQRVLTDRLLNNEDFWQGKNVQLPSFNRSSLPVTSLCFSAGRMAYGHTGDILQDLLEKDPETGMMVGVETYALRYCTELAVSDYCMTQLIYEQEKGRVTPKIQRAIQSVIFVDSNTESMTWRTLMELAENPRITFATINAPEGAYGTVMSGGGDAEPVSDAVKEDLMNGTVTSDGAKWTSFAYRRYLAGHPFALVSCTNFSSNGNFTGATLRMVAREWEKKGFVKKGFVDYLSDPARFSFPNCMIDRIAVAPDERTQEVMQSLGIVSNIVVTERTRYWVVEDLFPAGRPRFEEADGVFMVPDYPAVKKYEDMKLRILNMSHSVIAGLGVVLGYRGPYGIFKAMEDRHIPALIDAIIDIVVEIIDPPGKIDPRDFARAAIERLRNPNIPDDPMRIALNASTKMHPRFMETFFEGRQKGIAQGELDIILVPVAGFFRYTMGIDDTGESYELENDPVRESLIECGKKAELGNSGSAAAFDPLIHDTSIMGEHISSYPETAETVKTLVTKMIAGKGAVRETLMEYLKN
jgi:fructuronate reductase